MGRRSSTEERRAWAQRLEGGLGGLVHRVAKAGETRSKMGNRSVRVDGKRFASALEADRYLELKALRLAGQVRYFLRQAPFELAAGVTYRCDFLVVWAKPQQCRTPDEYGFGFDLVTIEDTKGFLTETARVKLRLVSELYGVHVRLLRRGDVKRMRT